MPKEEELEVLCIDDSITYTRGHFNTLFPKNESRRKVFGNIPERLHDEITAEAKRRNIHAFEFIAGLWDFFKQYEEEYKEELTAQRKTPQRR